MRPNKFSFSIGGFMGKSFELSTNEQANELTLTTYEQGFENKQTNTTDINNEWWNELEALIDSFRDWQRHYENSDILDGTSWTIRTRVNGKLLISDGLNAYPNEPDFPSVASDDLTEFYRLLAFLSATTGQEIN